MRRIRTFTRRSSSVVWETDTDLISPFFCQKVSFFSLTLLLLDFAAKAL